MKIKFPRYDKDYTDDGLLPEIMPNESCPKCLGSMVQSVSAEFCSVCGEVTVDYWPRATTEKTRWTTWDGG
jgi:hypothetical protein